MILKQPCIILAPHVSPFFFNLNQIEVFEKPKIIADDGSFVVPLKCFGTYSVNTKLTQVNMILSFIFTGALICAKGYWITDVWQAVSCVFVLLVIMVVGFVGVTTTHEKFETKKLHEICIKHERVMYIRCIEQYGFCASGSVDPFSKYLTI